MDAQGLIDEVFRLVGVVGESQDPSTAQRNTGLSLFNQMLDTWNAQNLLLPYKDTSSHALTIDDQEYSIGPSGDFERARPMTIELAMIRDSSNQDAEMDIISWKEFERIAQKAQHSGIPSHLTYQNTYPNGVIKIWPKPSSAYTLRLTTTQLFSTLALVTSIDNVPGYIEAMKYNLAERVANHYGRELSKTNRVIASESYRILSRRNADPTVAPVQTGVMQTNRNTGYDINRGY